MALTTTERDVLEQARTVIERGLHVHLCYALGHAAHELRAGIHTTAKYYDAANRLRGYIMTVLGDHATLDDWILARERRLHPRTHADLLNIPRGREERAEARLGWIRWMLGTGKRHESQQPRAKTFVDVEPSQWSALNGAVTVEAVPRVETLVRPLSKGILR